MNHESFERAMNEMTDEVEQSIFEHALDAIKANDVRELWALAAKIVTLPPGEQGQIASAAKQHFGSTFDIKGWKDELRKHRPRAFVQTTKRKIKVSNRDLDDVIRECIAAVEAANTPPRLFWRGSTMVMLQESDDGKPSLREVTPATMLDILTRSAAFVRNTQDGGEYQVEVPKSAAACMCQRDGREILLPQLVGVVEVPTFRPDGTLIETPGYDEATRLYYRPSITFPSIPQQIDGVTLQQAVDDIQDIICDFPFADKASWANTLAAIILPMARSVILGPTPLCIIEAPAAGTGKSMLAQIVSILATGTPDLLAWKDEERENEVSITASLLAQRPVVVLDNVTGILGGGSLCAAITSATVNVRVMGTSSMRTVDVRCAWVATANNVRIGDDMSRRIYRIRLDAKTAQPMQRTGFKHAQLLDYVAANRARLVVACLTIVRNWFERGCPRTKVVPLGSFESWHITMAGILSAAGIDGFLANLQEYLGRDGSTDEWETFLEGLDQEFDDVAFTVSDITKKLQEQESNLREMLPAWIGSKPADRRAQILGTQLQKYSNTRIGEQQIYCTPEFDDIGKPKRHWQTKAPLWRIKKGAGE